MKPNDDSEARERESCGRGSLIFEPLLGSGTSWLDARPHPLKYDRAGQFSVDLDGACRLVFAPANEPIPLNKDGSVAWAEVTAVRIIFIGDYHD